MPYSITFTKILRIENLNIWRDEESESVKVNLNVTLSNTDETQTDGYTKICNLTETQQQIIINFVKGKVQELGAELDVEIPPWTQP